MIWTPDHCDQPPCKIEVDNVTFAFQSFVQRCSAHQGAVSAQDFADLWDETKHYELLRDVILSNFPLLREDIVDGVANPKPLAAYAWVISHAWSSDAPRKLLVTLSTPAPTKTLIQNLADSTFGPGKIVVT